MEILENAHLMVVDATCRYRRPARYDDDLVIRTRIARFGRRTMHFDYQVVDATTRELLAEGTTAHVVTTNEGKPRTFPPQYAAMLTARLYPGDGGC